MSFVVAPPPSGTVPYAKELALALLRDMVRIRRMEERSAQLYGEAKIRGFLHLYIGEEAVAAGSRAARSLSPNRKKLRPVNKTEPVLSRLTGPPLSRSNACNASLASSSLRESTERDAHLRIRARAIVKTKRRVSSETSTDRSSVFDIPGD